MSEEKAYLERVKLVGPIAHPLASEKLNKKVLKVVKKATKANQVKRGVKEVVKGLRKGVVGFVVIAGDISPIDVISHVPVLCEDHDIPYVYVPTRDELGAVGATKRPTSCVLVVDAPKEEYKETFDEVLQQVKELNEQLITTVQ
jgi:H/ACA ribonucleoprotein complex subunit 2